MKNAVGKNDMMQHVVCAHNACIRIDLCGIIQAQKQIYIECYTSREWRFKLISFIRLLFNEQFFFIQSLLLLSR